MQSALKTHPEITPDTIAKALPQMFICSTPSPDGTVRVHTPLNHPEGGQIEVYIQEEEGHFIVTDPGLATSLIANQEPHRWKALVEESCWNLDVAVTDSGIQTTASREEDLGPAVMATAQAITRVASLVRFVRNLETAPYTS